MKLPELSIWRNWRNSWARFSLDGLKIYLQDIIKNGPMRLNGISSPCSSYLDLSDIPETQRRYYKKIDHRDKRSVRSCLNSTRISCRVF